MDAPSLDGRWFRPADIPSETVPDLPGDVRPDEPTVFRYSEQDGEVWGVYAGGVIRRGYLVGTRQGDRLEFRYVQLDASGNTATGHCRSTLRVLDDGRLRLDEAWQGQPGTGSGTGALEELPED
ncbi:MAG TPA: hypothetical protein VFX70_19720 [Mycobacteriales bacterium]|nr:hypothetical protein [Mycobacteriales bacterium]